MALRIFGEKRFRFVGGWRKIDKEEIFNFYSLPSKIEMIKLIRI
jgi:hypothetical protein